jgi:hypothetical protein
LLVLRILGLVAMIAIAVSAALFLVTRERRYLTFAWRLARYTVLAALAMFALLLFERLVVLV